MEQSKPQILVPKVLKHLNSNIINTEFTNGMTVNTLNEMQNMYQRQNSDLSLVISNKFEQGEPVMIHENSSQKVTVFNKISKNSIAKLNKVASDMPFANQSLKEKQSQPQMKDAASQSGVEQRTEKTNVQNSHLNL